MKALVLNSALAAMPAAFASDATPPAPAPARAGAKAGPRIEPIVGEVTKAVPMPEFKSGRGSASKYPFDALTEVGMSFPVMNKTAKQMDAIVRNQNRKGMVNKTDANGAVIYKTTPMKDANGNVIGQTPTTEPEKVAGVTFAVVEADKDDPAKGAKSRVFRRA